MVYDDNQTLLAANCEHNQQHTNSQNLLIQGDNLAVLKHLQEAYRQQVKMIYIAPPYNTGSDGFVYCDDRHYTAQQISAMTGESAESAERIYSFINRQSSSHSAWLTFMYPRLKIARELLREDGVIFISIDDNEQAQLKMLCDEVFGKGNFVGNIIWKRKRGRDNSAKWLSKSHEYLLMYSKEKDDFTVNYLELDDNTRKAYKNPDNDDRGNYRMLACWARGSQSGVLYDFTTKNGLYFSERMWLFSKENLTQMDLDNRLIIRGDNIYRKLFITENKGKIPETLWDNVSNAANASDEIKKLFRKIVFDTSKPIPYIQEMLKVATNPNDLILDFFAGSGTTAHAVMQLNAEDGGNRRYICVQLDEKTDPKSEAHKAGYPTIFDICKVRIEKAAAKIREEHPDYQGDLGFQEFKLMDYPEHYGAKPDNPQQGELFAELDLDKTTSQAILTTWCVKDGLPLTQTPTAVDLGDYTAFMAQDKLYVLDKGFNNDHLKQILKRLDDTQDEFNIARIVVLGHHFDSKTQRELKEAVMQYKTRKGNPLDLAVRYE